MSQIISQNFHEHILCLQGGNYRSSFCHIIHETASWHVLQQGKHYYFTNNLTFWRVCLTHIAAMQQHELWADHPFTYSALRGAILLTNHKVTVKPLTSWLRVKFLLGGSICKQLDNSTTSLTDEKCPISSPDSIKIVSILWKTISQAPTCSVFKSSCWKPTSNKACISFLILFYSHTEDLR